MDQVPSPIAGLEYFPSGMKELTFPLSQQIFLPSRSATVAGVAIAASDSKNEARVGPMKRMTFAVISAPLREWHRWAMLAGPRSD
jgi:hypothetical protein